MIVRSFIILVCLQFLLKANSSSESLYDEIDYSQDGQYLPYCFANDSNTSSWGSCPPWSTCKNNSCSCATLSRNIHIHCARSYTEIASCMCLTYNKENNTFALGGSIFCCDLHSSNPFNDIQIPNHIENFTTTMCRKHRRNGTLCGKCIDKYWPSVYSYNLTCIECKHSKWPEYVLATLGPMTVFYIVVLTLKIRITSPYVYSFVFYAQAISMSHIVRIALMYVENNIILTELVKIISSFYGIWSLDFFRSYYSDRICLRIGILEAYALELVHVLYPILLVIISYLIIQGYNRGYKCFVYTWKSFSWLLAMEGSGRSRRSLVDAYIVFLNVSVSKVLNVAINLLIPSVVTVLDTERNSKHKLVLFWDGTISYMSRAHLPYITLALIFIQFFITKPTIVLFFYQFRIFQVLLNKLPVRIRIILHHYVEKFQGHYKDGTGTSRDCRSFSVFYIVFSFFMAILYAINSSDFFLLSGSFLMVATFMLYSIQPYKDKFANIIACFFLFLLSLQYLTIHASRFMVFDKNKRACLQFLAALMAIFPIIYFIILVSHKVLKNTDCWKRIVKYRYYYMQQIQYSKILNMKS